MKKIMTSLFLLTLILGCLPIKAENCMFLSETQINEINQTHKLPDNCVIIKDSDSEFGYSITFKTLALFLGSTNILPPNKELKRTILGQTIVVPLGYTRFDIR